MDVIAHEFQHGYTENFGNLMYSSSPGAISEGYSDIIGNIVEMVYDPNQAKIDSNKCVAMVTILTIW